MKNAALFSALFVAAMLATGCESEGPLEQAGENMDETIEDVGNAVEDACEDVKEQTGASDKDC